MIENPGLIYHLTDKLYPMIAERYNTTSSAVAKGISRALIDIWDNGNRKELVASMRWSPDDKPSLKDVLVWIALYFGKE